jgi:polysaccharide biosynthesis/export protein
MKSKTNTYRFTKISIILVITVLSSCASTQEVIRFQDEPIANAIENLNSNFELRFKTDDLLTIDVSAIDPLVARPFNLPVVSYNPSVINAQGVLKMQTYLIDTNGNIEFPVLGTITIGGLTRGEANSFLKEKLTEYIKNPIVNIRLANFTITVLGEVNSPGTYTVQDEKISLIEALGLAGDLTIQGRRDNILLVREIDGEKRYTFFDLTSINVVNSQNYYLTQNDFIYVEPNTAKIKSSSYNQNNGIILGAVGILVTIAAILVK